MATTRNTDTTTNNMSNCSSKIKKCYIMTIPPELRLNIYEAYFSASDFFSPGSSKGLDTYETWLKKSKPKHDDKWKIIREDAFTLVYDAETPEDKEMADKQADQKFRLKWKWDKAHSLELAKIGGFRAGVKESDEWHKKYSMKT